MNNTGPRLTELTGRMGWARPDVQSDGASGVSMSSELEKKNSGKKSKTGGRNRVGTKRPGGGRGCSGETGFGARKFGPPCANFPQGDDWGRDERVTQAAVG